GRGRVASAGLEDEDEVARGDVFIAPRLDGLDARALGIRRAAVGDAVEGLHDLDEADGGAGLELVADLHERRPVRAWTIIVAAGQRRAKDELSLGCSGARAGVLRGRRGRREDGIGVEREERL